MRYSWKNWLNNNHPEIQRRSPLPGTVPILSMISAILLLISLRGGGTGSSESISAGENTAIVESNGLAENTDVVENTDIAENTVSGEASQDAPIRRLDENGYLYYMNYDKDYYSPEVRDAMRKGGLLDPGCSSFAARIKKSLISIFWPFFPTSVWTGSTKKAFMSRS